MKYIRVMSVSLALAVPPVVGLPAYDAMKSGRAPVPVAAVEAAGAAVATAAIAPAQVSGEVMPTKAPLALVSGPNAADIERCKRIISPVKVPKRQSIMDDMDSKKDAAINTANARFVAGQRCLDGLR